MFEPTSWVILGALVAAFVGLLAWLVSATNVGLQIAAAVLAFGVSALFGAALVNRYYAYYTTWGALYADTTGVGIADYHPIGSSATAGSGRGDAWRLPAAGAGAVVAPLPPRAPKDNRSSAPGLGTVLSPGVGDVAQPTPGSGKVLRLDLPGDRAGLSRRGLVYLPPQYFDPQYAHTAFPVLELLHGDPGDPTNWVYGLHVPDLMNRAINRGAIGPMVIVMPATFDGAHGQDCMNIPRRAQDDTYLSIDVPNDIASTFRVLPPGAHWAIGGLSDGGFCAANLALRHPGRFGAVASIDGFFTPARSASLAAVQAANNPSLLVTDSTHPLPQFWIMSGTANPADARAAADFTRLVNQREPVTSVVVHNGKHTMPAWRAVLPSMLDWVWRAVSGQPVAGGSVTFGLPAQLATPNAANNHVAEAHGGLVATQGGRAHYR